MPPKKQKSRLANLGGFFLGAQLLFSTA